MPEEDDDVMGNNIPLCVPQGALVTGFTDGTHRHFYLAFFNLLLPRAGF